MAPRSLASRRYLGFRGLDRRQYFPAPGDKKLAFSGQNQTARGSRQQRDAQPVLDAGHEFGER